MKTVKVEKARVLRSQGFSIKEICQQLGVSKGSVSVWVRDITLTPEQVGRLEEREFKNRERFGYLSRCGGANTNKANGEKCRAVFRQAGYDRAKKDPTFRVICALYWGEGQKRGHVFGVSNSDPELQRVILRWLVREGYDDAIRFCVRYHPTNGLSEEEIRAWWFGQLPLLKQKHLRKFGRCLIHRASQQKKIGALPYGTASLAVCRTELHSKVLGGIDYLRTSGDW